MNDRRMQLIEHFTTRCSIAIEEAKKKADMICNLQDELSKRDVRFKFLKKDGTIRDAYGTLHKDVIPPTMGTGRPWDLDFSYSLTWNACRTAHSRKRILYHLSNQNKRF